jgi:hypothetical protein
VKRARLDAVRAAAYTWLNGQNPDILQGDLHVSSDQRAGYWKDKQGEWHKDRRAGGDRRDKQVDTVNAEKRRAGRRREDRIIEQEHKTMVKEALEDLANPQENES